MESPGHDTMAAARLHVRHPSAGEESSKETSRLSSLATPVHTSCPLSPFSRLFAPVQTAAIPVLPAPSPVKSPDPRASTRCSVKVAPPSSRSSTGQIISRLLNCRRSFVAKVFVAEARFPRNTRWRFESCICQGQTRESRFEAVSEHPIHPGARPETDSQ